MNRKPTYTHEGKRLEKLNESYERPTVTYQDQMTNEQIIEKLKGYEKVDNIKDVPIDTHVRYFTKDELGKPKFRNGGLLYRKNDADTYVMLSNGKQIWSVQTRDAVFFRKLNYDEQIIKIKENYDAIVMGKDEEIAELKEETENLRKEIDRYKSILKM